MREMLETNGAQQIRIRTGLGIMNKCKAKGATGTMGKDGLAAATRPSWKGQPMPMSLRRSWSSDTKGVIPDRLLAMKLWGMSGWSAGLGERG